eukprot:4995690-Amphidinium_carterae.1
MAAGSGLSRAPASLWDGTGSGLAWFSPSVVDCCSNPQIRLASQQPSMACACTYARRSLSSAGSGLAWNTGFAGSGTGSSGRARSFS